MVTHEREQTIGQGKQPSTVEGANLRGEQLTPDKPLLLLRRD